MNENCEDVIVPGQGIKRVDILDLQIAIGFSGSNRFLYLIWCCFGVPLGYQQDWTKLTDFKKYWKRKCPLQYLCNVAKLDDIYFDNFTQSCIFSNYMQVHLVMIKLLYLTICRSLTYVQVIKRSSIIGQFVPVGKDVGVGQKRTFGYFSSNQNIQTCYMWYNCLICFICPSLTHSSKMKIISKPFLNCQDP